MLYALMPIDGWILPLLLLTLDDKLNDFKVGLQLANNLTLGGAWLCIT